MRTRGLFAWLLMFNVGCGVDVTDRVSPDLTPFPQDAAEAPGDAAPRVDGGDASLPVSSKDAAADSPPLLDAAPDVTSSCVPTAGPTGLQALCASMNLAIVTRDDGFAEARVYGNLMLLGTPLGPCATVDTVDVKTGTTVVSTLTGTGPIQLPTTGASLASGPIAPAFSSVCATDDRVERYTLIVRGRVDGGTFEARCGADPQSGSWPPGMVLTCHRNVDEPAYAASASNIAGRSEMRFGFRHGPKGTLRTVSPTTRIVPRLPSWEVTPKSLVPLSLSQWDTTVAEIGSPTAAATSLTFSKLPMNLSTDFCPLPKKNPQPSDPRPPVLLVQMSGTGDHGPFTTEALVSACTTTGM